MSAAKHVVRIILLLDIEQLAVILLSPEPPLPVAGIQRVLGLVLVEAASSSKDVNLIICGTPVLRQLGLLPSMLSLNFFISVALGQQG